MAQPLWPGYRSASPEPGVIGYNPSISSGTRHVIISHPISDKAALRGEPSYVWREGQERRLAMLRSGAGERVSGIILVDGCGVGHYLARLNESAKLAVGLDIELERAIEAHQKTPSSDLRQWGKVALPTRPVRSGPQP